MAQPLRVEPLLALALVDEGELDWKILCRREGSSYVPDEAELSRVRTWFRDYKTADKKPQNRFAFGGRFLDQKTTLEVIGDAHEEWRALCQTPVDRLWTPPAGTPIDRQQVPPPLRPKE